jgi:hypothetical protein
MNLHKIMPRVLGVALNFSPSESHVLRREKSCGFGRKGIGGLDAEFIHSVDERDSVGGLQGVVDRQTRCSCLRGSRHGETGGASVSDDNDVVTILCAGELASEVLMHGEQQREQRARRQRLFERIALADFL